jgi:hypothetical protein
MMITLRKEKKGLLCLPILVLNQENILKSFSSDFIRKSFNLISNTKHNRPTEEILLLEMRLNPVRLPRLGFKAQAF